MSTRGRSVVRSACAIVALATLLTYVPPSLVHSMSGPAAVFTGRGTAPAAVGPVAGASSESARPSANPNASVPVIGPLQGHYYVGQTSAHGAALSDSNLVVDPTTDTIYAINWDVASVTALRASNGTLIGELPLTADISTVPGYAALDPVHHELFVPVESYASRTGFVLVVSESPLRIVANITAFPGTTAFEPTYAAYDPFSEQVFVEGASNEVTAIIDTATNSVTKVLTNVCATSPCYSQGYVVVPRHEYLLVLTASSFAPMINTSTDSLAGGYTAPSSAFSIYRGAYDPVDDRVFVANSTRGEVVGFDALSGVTAVTLAGAPDPVSLAYDNVGLVLESVANFSHPYTMHEVVAFNAVAGNLVQDFNPATGGLYEEFEQLVTADEAGGHFLFTTGYDPNSTVEIGLTGSAYPYLTQLLAYPHFAYFQGQTAVDPSLGYYYVLQSEPNQIVAYRESSPGSVAFAIPINDSVYDYDFAVDSGRHLIYLADYSGLAIQVYSGSTGAWVQTISLGFNPEAVAADSVHHLLYVAPWGYQEIEVLNVTASGPPPTALYPLPGTFVCRLVADDVQAYVAASGCRYSDPHGNVSILNGYTGAVEHVYPSAPSEWATAFDSAGNFLLGNRTTLTVTSYVPATGAIVGTTPTGAFGPDMMGVDPVRDVAVLENYTTSEVVFVDLAGHSVAGSWILPAATGPAVADPITGTIIVPEWFSDRSTYFSILALPAAPASVAVAPGNTTLDVSWPAVAGPSGLPVNYTVSWSTASGGPWTSSVSTTTNTSVLSGLADGTTYYVVVRAVAVSGQSPPSRVASGVPAGVPFPPTQVTASASGEDGIAVRWSAPASVDGSAIVAYTLEYSTSSAGPWTSVGAGTSLARTVTGLSASTTYYVRVTATNGVGTGHPSATASAVTGSRSFLGLGGSAGLILVGLLVLVGAVVAALAILLARRRRTSGPGGMRPDAYAPPENAPPGAVGAPPPPPPPT